MASTDATTIANRSAMTPERLVVIFTLFLGIVLVLWLKHVIAPVWVAVGLPDRPLIEGAEEWTYSSLVAIALTVGLLGGAWASPRIRHLAFETASELMRVTWPGFAETRVSTVAVVVASLVAGVVLFAIDTLSYKLMVEWLPAMWGKL
ncbi:MAG TPA: preprotein translocase subunit SecE [Myxococcaceae bacterium]|jgi:preprotein translocase subunit SecE|nr:preprotein translocase subunit SecE [Myxococcaceae bacterium]